MNVRIPTTAIIALLAAAPLVGCDADPERTVPAPSVSSSSTASASESEPSPEPTPPTIEGDDWLLYETSAATVAYTRLDGSASAFPLIDAASVPSPQDNPDWSPDGSRITFVSGDGLWVMDADGSDANVLVPIAEPSFVDDPAWSPDGRTIAFSRTVMRGDQFTSTLETANVADGTTEVVAGPWHDALSAGVAWSPDGARLAFEWVHFPRPSLDVEPNGVDLAVLALGSGRVATLLDPARWPETATWSPDGRWIAFGYRPNPGGDAPDLYRVRPDGSDLRRVTTLTDRAGFATHPSFTRDGASLVFSGAGDPDESGQLLRVPVNGGRPRPLGPEPVFGSHPKVRPAS